MKSNKIPIKDYIPEDVQCVICGQCKCNGFYVEGYMHYSCYVNDLSTRPC